MFMQMRSRRPARPMTPAEREADDRHARIVFVVLGTVVVCSVLALLGHWAGLW